MRTVIISLSAMAARRAPELEQSNVISTTLTAPNYEIEADLCAEIVNWEWMTRVTPRMIMEETDEERLFSYLESHRPHRHLTKLERQYCRFICRLVRQRLYELSD